MQYRRSQIPSFAKVRKAIERVARDALFDAIREYAEAARDDFVARIEATGFASFRIRHYPDSPLNPNLSPAWVDRKVLAGADLRTMIATGWYIDNIDVHVRKGRGPNTPSMTFFVGPDSRIVARDLKGRRVRGFTLDLLAKTHEYGTHDGNIPPRPHWTPQLNRMKRAAPRARREIAKRVTDALKGSATLRPYVQAAMKKRR